MVKMKKYAAVLLFAALLITVGLNVTFKRMKDTTQISADSLFSCSLERGKLGFQLLGHCYSLEKGVGYGEELLQKFAQTGWTVYGKLKEVYHELRRKAETNRKRFFYNEYSLL